MAGVETGLTARADACFDATRAELDWGHPDGGRRLFSGRSPWRLGVGVRGRVARGGSAFQRRVRERAEQGKGIGGMGK